MTSKSLTLPEGKGKLNKSCDTHVQSDGLETVFSSFILGKFHKWSSATGDGGATLVLIQSELNESQLEKVFPMNPTL